MKPLRLCSFKFLTNLTKMCKLWTTEPSKSLIPYYFVVEGLESSIDTIGEGLVDVGYNGPITFDSAETEAYQLNKGDVVIFLHLYNTDECSYLTGLATPVIPNVSKLRRERMIEAILGLAFIIYIGIVIGIALAGLGVRGEPRPYLLEWLSQNIAILIGIGILLFIIPFGLCFRFVNLNLNDCKYQVAVDAHTDLTMVLSRYCPNIQLENITIIQNPKTVEEKDDVILPKVVREPLEHLVSVIDGLNKIDGTILDINLKPIRPDETRTY